MCSYKHSEEMWTNPGYLDINPDLHEMTETDSIGIRKLEDSLINKAVMRNSQEKTEIV